MSRRRHEMLRYRGRDYPVLGDPLASCRNNQVRRRMAELGMRPEASWPEHCAMWAVARSRLWLVKLQTNEHILSPDGVHVVGWGERPADLLFPGTSGPVPADWYIGEIVTGMGAAARVAQFGRDWQRYRVFAVERGVVVHTEVRDNTAKFREGVAGYERFARRLDDL